MKRTMSPGRSTPPTRPSLKREARLALIGTDSDFSGKLEDWDDRVFLAATYFRVHRVSREQKRDYAQFSDFPSAIRAARDALKEGFRVVVYAVTAQERYQALVPARWEHYAGLYNRKKNAE